MRRTLAVALALLSTAGTARADSTSISSDALWPTPGPQRFAYVASTAITTPGNFGLALVSTYQKRPIDLHVATPGPSGTTTPAIDNQVDGTLVASFGVVDRLAAFVAIPATLHQDGAGSGPVGGHTPAAGGLGDPRFGLGGSLFSSSKLAVAAYAAAQIPTGSTPDFDGEKGVVVAPTVTAETRFAGRFVIGADLGARIRPVPQSFFGARQTTQLTFALGVGVDVLPRDLLSFGLEARALVDVEPRTGGEWLASARSAPGAKGFSVLAGGGGTLPLGGLIGIGRVRVVLGLAYTR